MTPEQIEKLDEATRKKLEAAQSEVQRKMREAMRRIQQQNRAARDRGSELDRQTIANATGHLIDELNERYAQYPGVVQLLDAIRKDILENVQAIKQVKQLEQMQAEQGPMACMFGKPQLSFDQYRVNLIVNNCDAQGRAGHPGAQPDLP